MNCKIINTRLGDIEYSSFGKGIPILFLHGGHSNCYEKLCHKGFDLTRFQLITPSRPGYGETPLNNKKTPKKAAEQGYDIPPIHFENVQAALTEFDKDFLGSTTETTTDKADAISAQAKKFMRDFKSITRKDDTKKACEALLNLIDKGTFTPLPNEIRKLKRQLDKKTISYGQADNLIVAIAQKYDAFDTGEDEDSLKVEIDLNVTPEIVITETFID